MSSPYYQSSGKAEVAVKQAKRILKVAKATGQDPHLALLDLRNTPQEGFDTNLAQKLMSRTTRTFLPTSDCLLTPSIGEDIQQTIYKRKERQKKVYNKGARDLPALEEGDQVWVQPFKLREKEWKKATVLRKAGIRSYEVQVEDKRILIRNKRHLKAARQREKSTSDHLVREDPQSTPEFGSELSVKTEMEPVRESDKDVPVTVPSATSGEELVVSPQLLQMMDLYVPEVAGSVKDQVI